MRHRKERKEVRKEKGTKGGGDKKFSNARIKVFTQPIIYERLSPSGSLFRFALGCRKPQLS